MSRVASHRADSGMSLIELLITLAVLTAIMAVVTGVFLNTSRFEQRTVRRADAQTSLRQAITLMTTELRQAGVDPADPPIGLIGLVVAGTDSIRIRGDRNGNGVLETAEPSEQIAYRFDAANRRILRDPGAGPATLVNNVTALQLTYFDDTNTALTPLPLSAANAALVKSVGVTLTSEDRNGDPITLTSRILLRNR